MSYTVLLTILAGFACTIGAFYVGVQVTKHKLVHDPRVVGLMKQIGELQIDLANLHDLYERLMTSHKRLRSSAGMAKLRGMKADKADGLSEAEILRRTNHYGVQLK